jgi:hypothetical protein
MATAAQIEANRRNSKRSTGPVTQNGKNRSKLNALVHGCRAEILVLPTEDPDLFEDRSRTWRLRMCSTISTLPGCTSQAMYS